MLCDLTNWKKKKKRFSPRLKLFSIRSAQAHTSTPSPHTSCSSINLNHIKEVKPSHCHQTHKHTHRHTCVRLVGDESHHTPTLPFITQRCSKESHRPAQMRGQKTKEKFHNRKIKVSKQGVKRQEHLWTYTCWKCFRCPLALKCAHKRSTTNRQDFLAHKKVVLLKVQSELCWVGKILARFPHCLFCQLPVLNAW